MSFGDTFGIGEIRSELVIGLGGMNIESLNISDLLFLKNSIVFISSK